MPLFHAFESQMRLYRRADTMTDYRKGNITHSIKKKLHFHKRANTPRRRSFVTSRHLAVLDVVDEAQNVDD